MVYFEGNFKSMQITNLSFTLLTMKMSNHYCSDKDLKWKYVIFIFYQLNTVSFQFDQQNWWFGPSKLKYESCMLKRSAQSVMFVTLLIWNINPWNQQHQMWAGQCSIAIPSPVKTFTSKKLLFLIQSSVSIPVLLPTLHFTYWF